MRPKRNRNGFLKIVQNSTTQLNPPCLKLFSISIQMIYVVAVVFKGELILVGKKG